ncbi:hypothetical protein GGX14DRAFT_596419 [Mycena pura]|uniref:Uncharacterized protein n=1 Tax=Mycena pura TaxID=153505 RepID=A0AAD6XY23_9AGAR|nr:hypothetical protein GGX14DRAFT_596419 [Mycena pura]
MPLIGPERNARNQFVLSAVRRPVIQDGKEPQCLNLGYGGDDRKQEQCKIEYNWLAFNEWGIICCGLMERNRSGEDRGSSRMECETQKILCSALSTRSHDSGYLRFTADKSMRVFAFFHPISALDVARNIPQYARTLGRLRLVPSRAQQVTATDNQGQNVDRFMPWVLILGYLIPCTPCDTLDTCLHARITRGCLLLPPRRVTSPTPHPPALALASGASQEVGVPRLNVDSDTPPLKPPVSRTPHPPALALASGASQEVGVPQRISPYALTRAALYMLQFSFAATTLLSRKNAAAGLTSTSEMCRSSFSPHMCQRSKCVRAATDHGCPAAVASEKRRAATCSQRAAVNGQRIAVADVAGGACGGQTRVASSETQEAGERGRRQACVPDGKGCVLRGACTCAGRRGTRARARGRRVADEGSGKREAVGVWRQQLEAVGNEPREVGRMAAAAAELAKIITTEAVLAGASVAAPAQHYVDIQPNGRVSGSTMRTRAVHGGRGTRDRRQAICVADGGVLANGREICATLADGTGCTLSGGDEAREDHGVDGSASAHDKAHEDAEAESQITAYLNVGAARGGWREDESTAATLRATAGALLFHLFDYGYLFLLAVPLLLLSFVPTGDAKTPFPACGLGSPVAVDGTLHQPETEAYAVSRSTAALAAPQYAHLAAFWHRHGSALSQAHSSSSHGANGKEAPNAIRCH